MRSEISFANEEAAVMSLSRMYRQYGFKHYKMSKFEEYDLYSQNKDFLLGSRVIAFTDTNGSLMALKPDVTLSIVKNSNDVFSEPEKVYYSENVYRVDKGTHRFKELTQIGLECIGDLDIYAVSEVIMLAKKSLDSVCGHNILDISHMGFLKGLMDGQGLSERKMNKLIDCVRSKNSMEMEERCKEFGISFDTANALCRLTGLYGAFPKCIEELKEISVNDATEKAVRELSQIYEFLDHCGCSQGVNLDFSIVSDLNYYNGVIFHGFIEGVPNSVLSGGRYDNLMRKFGKKSGAIGFAVYLDQLSWLMRSDEEYDVDALVLYDDNTKLSELSDAVNGLVEEGKSVRAQKNDRGILRYKTLVDITGGEADN